MSAKEQELQDQQGKKERQKINWQSFLSIYSYVLPYKLTFLIGMVFLVLSTVTALLFPAVIGSMLDVSMGGGNSKVIQQLQGNLPNLSVNGVALILMGILVLQAVFSMLKVITFAYVSENTMADIRKDLYSKMLHLPLSFYDKNRVGELISRITNDVTQLQDALSWTLGEFFRQIVTLIVGGIFIFWVSPKLSLWMISTFPLLIIVAVFLGRFIKRLSKKTQKALADANVVAEESLQNIQSVKSFTNEQFEYKRYSKSITEVVSLALKTAAFRGGFFTFFILGIFGGVVLVFWKGASMIAEGTLTVGELTSFIIYTIYIGGSVGGIGDIYSRILKAVGATDRVREILREEEEDKRTAGTSSLSGDIVYNNIHFTYPTREDMPVLKGLDLNIKEGEKIAFVGASGAGKSTIIQLLMRLYDWQNGTITINGQSIKDIPLKQLRDNVGIVPQEVILFGGTIKENILYGNPEASEQEVTEAAKQANALEFINSFPEGLETLVGERGVKLSGGQRQRIAIARAILKDPAILILDEATSSLDSESERLVQDALDVLMEGRTSLIIAHRLSTIREVDCINVIENGKVVESGTHHKLLEIPKGKYRSFLELQNESVGV